MQSSMGFIVSVNHYFFLTRIDESAMQGYGFVEYALPSAATKAKSALDVLSQSMRPDAQKRQDGVSLRHRCNSVVCF